MIVKCITKNSIATQIHVYVVVIMTFVMLLNIQADLKK